MILVFLLALVVARYSGPPNLSEPTLPSPSRLAVIACLDEDVLSSRLRIFARAAASPCRPCPESSASPPSISVKGTMEYAVKHIRAQQATD